MEMTVRVEYVNERDPMKNRPPNIKVDRAVEGVGRPYITIPDNAEHMFQRGQEGVIQYEVKNGFANATAWQGQAFPSKDTPPVSNPVPRVESSSPAPQSLPAPQGQSVTDVARAADIAATATLNGVFHSATFEEAKALAGNVDTLTAIFLNARKAWEMARNKHNLNDEINF